MEETYTFSRALHMMRYGGKKMVYIDWKGIYAWVDGDQFKISNNTSVFQSLCDFEIMGSWVEVKDE